MEVVHRAAITARSSGVKLSGGRGSRFADIGQPGESLLAVRAGPLAVDDQRCAENLNCTVNTHHARATHPRAARNPVGIIT